VRRRYCSRCLQTFGSPADPDFCARPTCDRHRPPDGWPAFLSYADVIADRYEVQEILGAGGAGITYRCRDARNNDVVAVKLLHSDRSTGVLAHRLAIEGEVLELLHHDHIVPFRALNLVGPTVYLVTNWMPGGSLDSWIRKHGELSPEGVLEMGRQLALALDYVHAGGIIHRDLKPGNVLLEIADDTTPVVRLGDFGIARLFKERNPMPGLTRTGAFIGTPEYAAPEQRRGEASVGPAADSFALGALLHYSACGVGLHRREEILDWQAFRDREWDPADRPRLTEWLGSPSDELSLLDEVIDALMHTDPRLRLDMAGAALRLGADPAALAPHDLLTFSPPSLVTSADHDLDAIDLVAAAGFDALVPGDDEDSTGDRTLLGPLMPSPVADREPLLELPSMGLVTRNASEDWEYEDLEWPPADVQRNRRHGRLLLLLAVLLGVALAYPGGPAAMPGADRLAGLHDSVGAFTAKLSLPAPTSTLRPPPKKKPALAVPSSQAKPARTKARRGPTHRTASATSSPEARSNPKSKAGSKAGSKADSKPPPKPTPTPRSEPSPEPDRVAVAAEPRALAERVAVPAPAPPEPTPPPAEPVDEPASEPSPAAITSRQPAPEAIASTEPPPDRREHIDRIERVAGGQRDSILAIPGDEPADSAPLDAERERYEKLARLRRLQSDADRRAEAYAEQARRQHARTSAQMERWTESQRRARELQDEEDAGVADNSVPGVGIPPQDPFCN